MPDHIHNAISSRKMGVNRIMTVTGALLITSCCMFGCSDNSNEANPSTTPIEGTMPKVNITNTPTTAAPTEQTTVTEEAATKTAPAEEPAPAAPTTPAPVPAPAEPVSQGEKIYKAGCFACHATGVAGAPTFGDKALWKERIAKGKDVLLNNAIKGFTGTTGVMPPKGGFAHFSDEDISAAIDYMIEAAQ